MFWRLLYFKYEWWGCFLFVWSYSQWSLLHSVEKCLQFSCTECTKWFCQLIFFFVKRFIYFSVGRTQKLSAASTRVAETVTPLSSDLVEIFFLLGKDTHTILCLCLGLLSPAKAAERSRSASQATDQRGHRASAALVPVVGTTFNLPALALH